MYWGRSVDFLLKTIVYWYDVDDDINGILMVVGGLLETVGCLLVCVS